MYVDDAFQLNILLYSVGFGFFLAFIYDVFKVFNLYFCKSHRSLIIKDVFYALTFSYLFFIFTLSINNGKIRVYIVLGILLGFICWFMSLSMTFLRYSEQLFKKFVSILNFVSTVISFPFSLFFSLLSKKIIKFKRNKPKKFDNIKNKLKIHLKKL